MKCSIQGCPGEYEEKMIIHIVRQKGEVHVFGSGLNPLMDYHGILRTPATTFFSIYACCASTDFTHYQIMLGGNVHIRRQSLEIVAGIQNTFQGKNQESVGETLKTG